MDVSPLGMVLLGHWPIDWLILGAVAIAFALDSMRSGTAKSTAAILAALTAPLVLTWATSAVALASVAAQFDSSTAQAILFGTVFFAMAFLFYRIVFTYADAPGIIKPVVLGVSTMIIVTLTWLHVPALDALWHFGASVRTVFADQYRLWWTLASLIGVGYVRG